jgi:hypothetical protein
MAIIYQTSQEIILADFPIKKNTSVGSRVTNDENDFADHTGCSLPLKKVRNIRQLFKMMKGDQEKFRSEYQCVIKHVTGII